MGESSVSLQGGRENLGAKLAVLRVAAGYTQEAFAPLTFYGRSSIANIETGRQSAPRAFWERCDEVLKTGGLLTEVHDRLAEQRAAAEVQRLVQQRGHTGYSITALAIDPPTVIPGLSNPGRPTEAQHVDLVSLPAGRFFAGTDLEVRILPATSDGRVLVQLPPDFDNDAFVTRNRRGLLVGAVPEPAADNLYGLDTRHAKRKLVGLASGSRLLIPTAYLLDEITVGLLWATANFDEALLNDDRILFEYSTQLGHLGGLKHSAAGWSLARGISATSAMWLGSEFCAQHILRNVGELVDIPNFWTREKHGEEASAWLLFAHKYTYLEQLHKRFPEGMTRSFCVPESAVSTSTTSERILMLLAAALMESFDIQCLVTSEPEYSTVDGFVLDSDRLAIVANWVGTEGLWFVDVTETRSAVREYTDANGYVRAHSTIAASTPPARLQALAAYLGLGWRSITRRCAELAEYGLAGIAEPRSRHLSLSGADRACRYLGRLSTTDGR